MVSEGEEERWGEGERGEDGLLMKEVRAAEISLRFGI